MTRLGIREESCKFLPIDGVEIFLFVCLNGLNCALLYSLAGTRALLKRVSKSEGYITFSFRKQNSVSRRDSVQLGHT